jgi:precorrin-2/cobalt-factor-2 C20-methyltransferase
VSADHTPPTQIGTLYGIGVGPGDPELLTVKGLRILQQASIVAFPAGIGDRQGIAQQIVSPWLRSEQIQLPLTFPYVRDEVELDRAWKHAAQTAWQHLKQGKDIAFVSEGDVSFYSTFTYLAQTLQQLYPAAIVQTIPGICSPLAAVAALGIPLTTRDCRLAVIPALYGLEALETALDWADTIVLMKVSSRYSEVWQRLQQRGLLASAYVVEHATLPQQVIYADLRDRPDLKLSYFSIAIVQVIR